VENYEKGNRGIIILSHLETLDLEQRPNGRMLLRQAIW